MIRNAVAVELREIRNTKGHTAALSFRKRLRGTGVPVNARRAHR
jgi:hypothetical protein